MARTYVIPDLHGRSDLLTEALISIEAHAAGDAATLVGLGDYVDKGPDSAGVIARLRAGVPDNFKTIFLKGNHDSMMVAALRDPERMTWWLERGGDAALRSYGGQAADVPPDDVDWLDRLGPYHVDDHRVFVHAGLDVGIPLVEQTERTLFWKRYDPGDGAGYGGRHVVHGHDAQKSGPVLLAGRTNLDAQAWRTGRLMVAVFDDVVAGGPVQILEVSGIPA